MKLITEAPVLALYQPEKPLSLENDACEYGLGSVSMQEGRPVAYASRTLTAMESRYSQIEKEMLAAVYGLEKFHHYTYARDVEVITDHKPLESIAKKPLCMAPIRLQNMLMRAKNYQCDIRYKPDTQIQMADTLSRSPVDKPLKREIIRSVKAYPIKNDLMSEIRAAAMEDETLTMLGEVIHRGWPAVARDVPEPRLAY